MSALRVIDPASAASVALSAMTFGLPLPILIPAPIVGARTSAGGAT